MSYDEDLIAENELALTVIRTETALRYPMHNLSCADPITIEITQADPGGGNSFLWEVTYNSKYGQPGRMAYKLDTIIVNRRIDEARGRGQSIPKVLRLGSLREIAQELGTGDGNTNAIKRALRQNAFAGLTVKGLRYRAADRTEQTFDFSDTRYGVVFTSETLPNGRKADAVHLVFHDLYLALLNTAMRRPLDYDYLKSLSPTEQRFYEILSYQMVAALKYKQRAKLRYSEYCVLSTQVRHFDLRRARDQMRVVHRPHILSGYIQRDPEFQPTTDKQGNPDWFILYKPDGKAVDDQRAFDFSLPPPARRKEPVPPPDHASDAPTVLATTAPILPLIDTLPLPAAPIEELARHFYQHWSESGSHALLTASDRILAEELLRSHSLDEAKGIVDLCIGHARTAFPALNTFSGARSLMGIAIAAYERKKEDRERVGQRQQAKAHQAARDSHINRFLPHFAAYLEASLEGIAESRPEQCANYREWREDRRRGVCKPPAKPESVLGRKLLENFDHPEEERKRLAEFFQAVLMDFWEWDAALNPASLSNP